MDVFEKIEKIARDKESLFYDDVAVAYRDMIESKQFKKLYKMIQNAKDPKVKKLWTVLNSKLGDFFDYLDDLTNGD